MPTHPPPYRPIAPHRPINTVDTTLTDTTTTTIATHTQTYEIPQDWWRLTCIHATKYDPEFCDHYIKIDEEGALLCLAGYREAATIPFHLSYWTAIEYFLTKVASSPVPDSIILTTQREIIHWATFRRNWTRAITSGPWDIV